MSLSKSLEDDFHSRLSPDTERIFAEALKKVYERYKSNTQEAVAQIMASGELTGEFADCRRHVSQYADLCRKDELSEVEHCQLTVIQLSLYPTFGNEGTEKVLTTWVLAEHIRQIRTG